MGKRVDVTCMAVYTQSQKSEQKLTGKHAAGTSARTGTNACAATPLQSNSLLKPGLQHLALEAENSFHDLMIQNWEGRLLLWQNSAASTAGGRAAQPTRAKLEISGEHR